MNHGVLKFLLLLFTAAAPAQDLKLGVHTGLGWPLVAIQGDKVTGGILFDLAEEVSRRSNLSILFMVIPRSRLDQAMAEGWINVRPYSSVSWVADPGVLEWSPVLFQASDRFMTLKGQEPITSLSQLQGKILGTLLGYRYPTLQPLFDNGTLMNTGVTSISQNYQMLLAQRIDVLIASDLMLLAKAKELGDIVMVHPFLVEAVDVRWAFAPGTLKQFPNLKTVLADLVETGTVDRILAKYR